MNEPIKCRRCEATTFTRTEIFFNTLETSTRKYSSLIRKQVDYRCATCGTKTTKEETGLLETLKEEDANVLA